MKKQEQNRKFDWKELLLDVLKLAIGAAAGWLGAGTV